MLESENKTENVKVSQSSKCKRTRRMFTLIGTMDPGSWFHLISLSQTMVAIMLQDDKSTHNCHALMVNFYSGYMS